MLSFVILERRILDVLKGTGVFFVLFSRLLEQIHG